MYAEVLPLLNVVELRKCVLAVNADGIEYDVRIEVSKREPGKPNTNKHESGYKPRSDILWSRATPSAQHSNLVSLFPAGIKGPRLRHDMQHLSAAKRTQLQSTCCSTKHYLADARKSRARGRAEGGPALRR